MYATKGRYRKWPLTRYKTITNDELLDRGEPFIFDVNSPHNGLPLIRLCGPGRYWKQDLGDLLIIGVPVDSKERNELAFILGSRREGEIWGRWHSKYCVEGELGFRHIGLVDEISEDEFLMLLHEIQTPRTKTIGIDV